ncbi:MAG: Rieske (2Fe-2S) protein [Bauldia sp.]
MSKHVVAAVREIPPGSRKLVTIKGRPVAIFNIKGEFFGLLNRCPHQGGSLCEGALIGLIEATLPSAYKYSRQGEILRCPWHGWEFDIRTGQSYFDPKGVLAKNYPVEIEPGTQVAKGPYVAEKIDVVVEEDYVVVSL